jgi:hypothetical protein
MTTHLLCAPSMADGVVAPFRHVEGSEMKRVTQFDIYLIGFVRALSYLRKGDYILGYHDQISMSWVSISSFCNNDLNKILAPNSVKEAGFLNAILDILGNTIPGKETASLSGKYVTEDGEITEMAAGMLSRAVASFETALKHELNALPTYIIEKTGIYDTDDLLTRADAAFADDLVPHIPAKSMEDFKKAGACLAFELFTASGFHGFRAVDSALRAYCVHFAGRLPAKRDWGSFLQAVRTVTGEGFRVPNARTIELIDRIRAEDRNPLIHPETDLDRLQANTAFDLCRSAIIFMAMDVKNAP